MLALIDFPCIRFFEIIYYIFQVWLNFIKIFFDWLCVISITITLIFNIIVAPKIATPHWFVITFFLYFCKKSSYNSDYFIFNCFFFFQNLKKISYIFNCVVFWLFFYFFNECFRLSRFPSTFTIIFDCTCFKKTPYFFLNTTYRFFIGSGIWWINQSDKKFFKAVSSSSVLFLQIYSYLLQIC